MATHDHDQGLAEDLATLASRARGRRDLIKWALGTGFVAFAGCNENDGAGDSAGGDSGTRGGHDSGTRGGHDSGTRGGHDAETGVSCTPTPTETEGPFPGDGTNGANALALSGVVRGDIRASVGDATGVAEGVPLTVKLKVVDGSSSCSPLAGHAVYLWHCDRDGDYSMYSAAAADENYLRGVQETASDGTVTFTTIFPGCYSGRWPHMHFEVYPSLDVATSGTNKVATSQLAFPEDACRAAYAAPGYDTSVANLANVSLEGDGVFRDGVSSQLAAVTGNATDGYTATLTVVI